MRWLLILTVAGVVAGCGGTSHSLPYGTVVYTVSDAQRAFATESVRLTLKSKGPEGTTLGDRRDVVEVDVFGDPAVLRHNGFRDLPHGRDCSVAGHLALHWHGNVRVILNCELVHDRRAWIARMNQGLARLG